LYPKLKRKYGPIVTYGEDPAAHLKTEFAFDVLQIAKGRYASQAYHDYIGFQVSRPLIERAFKETYALDINSIFADFDLTIGTYRHDVSVLIPKATVIAWQIKKDDIQKENPGISRQKFRYNLSRQEYRRQFGGKYKGPGLGTQLLAFVIRIIPKIGPLRTLAFRIPTPQTETLFANSVRVTVQDYQNVMRQKYETGEVALRNDDLDTGTVTKPGEYQMADKTYEELLDKLAGNHFAEVSPELRRVVLDYYSDTNAPLKTKKDAKRWAKVLRQIDALKAYNPQEVSSVIEESAPATPQN
jgi:hypothetical protein